MGKTILTSRQFKFLELAAKEKEIIRWYYLTGGTALAEFFLKHRLSDDIDLFTTSDVNDLETDKIIKKALEVLNAKKFTKRKISGLYTYQLIFADGSILKIDFNNYPFKQIERGLKWRGLNIDSYYDIAVNKVNTILGRLQIRDFIDLYFMLREEYFSLEQLITRTEDKFNIKVDQYYLASQFFKIIDFPRVYPKMLKPFSFEKIQEFFKKEAKRLGKSSL